MKKKKETVLAMVGMLFITLGLTIFEDHKTLKYVALISGIIIGIIAAFKAGKKTNN